MAHSRNRHNQKSSHSHGKLNSNRNEITAASIPNNQIPELKLRENRPWCPTTQTAFKVLLSARLCAAVWSGISDCDETYNYWEPTHYLMYKSGFQTWEYSPVYALRSYAYLWPQALFGMVYSSLLQPNKILVFYFIRCFLGFISAACEVYFYSGVCKAFGAHIGRLLLAFLVLSTGMFISATAYLPSTFSMYMIMLAFGAWFHQKLQISILTVAISSIVGWPFAIILGLPIAYDVVVGQKKILFFLQWCLISLIAILIPLVALDSRYYGRLIVAPLNILLYNVFTEHGPDIYGTEPWWFYFVNGFLNFNLIFIAAFSVPFVLLIQRFVAKPIALSNTCLLAILAMYFWIAVFFTRPHKEERFLFPIYPLVCLAASVSLDSSQRIISSFLTIKNQKSTFSHLDATNILPLLFVIISSVLSLSRSIALYQGYHAPMEVFLELNRISQEHIEQGETLSNPVNVCMGKEWHRFPSNYFMPPNWQLSFLQSEFKGQLPKPYMLGVNATLIIPDHMNDQNKEEPTRYAQLSDCHFLIDSDFSDATPLEPRYALELKDWTKVASIPFLDSKNSSRLFRSFYVPYFSETRCNYVDYFVLKRNKCKTNKI